LENSNSIREYQTFQASLAFYEFFCGGYYPILGLPKAIFPIALRVLKCKVM